MKKTISILLFTAFLLIPKLVYAGLSEGCFPAVECDAGEDYYADACNTHIEALNDCGAPPADQYYAFSCDNGCYLRSNSAPNPCPGGVMVGAICMTTLEIVKDSSDDDVYKIFDNPTLTHVAYGDCADNEVLSWDDGANSWACGPPNFTYFQAGAEAGEIYYNTGNVGIGTTDPDKDLTVGSTVSPGEMRLQGNASNKYLDMSADGITLSSGGTDYFTVDSSGNVSAELTFSSRLSLTSTEGWMEAATFMKAPQFCIGVDCISSWDQAGGSNIWALNTTKAYYNNGMVGIGTDDPSSMLEVYGNTFQTNSIIKSTVNDDGADRSIYIAAPDNDANKYAKIAMEGTNYPMTFWTGDTSAERMRIDYNGDVTIGSTYHVTLPAYGNELEFDRDGNNYITATDAAGQLIFRTGGDISRMIIASDGDVGIGTTTPYANLHVEGDGTNNLFRARISGTTQFIVNDIGNVGIGTALPVGKLHVEGTSFFTDDMDIADDKWIGLKASGGRIEFDDQVADEVNILGAKVGIGTTTPNAGLHIVNGITLDSFRVDDIASDTTPFVIDDTGNVSIGASTADYKLDVAGSIGMDDYIYHNGDPNTYMGFSSADHIKFYTSGDEQMYINDSGNYVAAGVNGNFMIDGNLDYTGTNTGMSISGPFYAQSLNGAGASPNTVMENQNESICFLTKVYVNETDSGSEDAGCYISTLSGNWVLAAYAESSDADAYCSARCLSF